MIKKLILFLGLLFCVVTAHAAEMVNVEYIHKLIARDWGIEIPYNPALTNPKVAANMKYLLTTVDVANRMLNGKKTTDYGSGDYATMVAADTIATNEAVARLIRVQPKFFITTTSDTDSFSFSMSAEGTFVVDWGDGVTEKIIRTDTTEETYSHNYAIIKQYTIGISGQATGYNAETDVAAISFKDNPKVSVIDGSLGAIFGTISNSRAIANQPSFFHAFYKNVNLQSIPDGLFAGVTGPAVSRMFRSTFQDCSKLKSIPNNLFSTITGPGANNMFDLTFGGCTSLQSIPEGLFSGITGPAASGMFTGTFQGCNNLQALPSGLFASITGPAASGMFSKTFQNCRSLKNIPTELFSRVIGPAAGGMFELTFSGCTSLQSIPEELFSTITGPAASGMFDKTFNNCKNLQSIPSGLFASITGPAASNMFNSTFASCVNLQSIPEGLFGAITTLESNTFYQTFYDCVQLSGQSAKINGKYLYEIWPDATAGQVGACYNGATELSDYANIPNTWK